MCLRHAKTAERIDVMLRVETPVGPRMTSVQSCELERGNMLTIVPYINVPVPTHSSEGTTFNEAIVKLLWPLIIIIMVNCDILFTDVLEDGIKNENKKIMQT